MFARNGKIVEKAKLKTDGIMKYFDRSKLSKQAPPTSKEATPPIAKSNGKAAVEEITQQASGLNISARKQQQGQIKGQKVPPPSSVSAIPDHVINEGTNGDAGGSVRRSPRLAKRARPLNDDVSKMYTHNVP